MCRCLSAYLPGFLFLSLQWAAVCARILRRRCLRRDISVVAIGVCIRSGVYSCNILFLFTCRRFQDFDALREGRIFARYVCFFVSELVGF